MSFDPSAYEEAKLIALLAADSEYAFQLLFDRHRNFIYRLAIRYLKSPAIAQEVVQDVFLKLWVQRKNLHSDKRLEPWLHRVAKNHIINQLEKLANEWKAIGALSKNKEISDVKIYDQLQEEYYNNILLQAIENLSEKQKQVFELARQKNLSYLQIAEKLGLSTLTVKTHMSRALHSIKAFFHKEGVVLLMVISILG
jgi:RNA polymerase sigma-70 factor (ECF subfamily)